MKHKTAVILSISIIMTFVVVGPALFVYVVDPFRIYHKPVFSEAKYSIKQPYQHAGWIKQLLADPGENYQTIIIGSSTMANYTQTLINNIIPWGKSLNLSINGSNPKMQHAVAAYALKKNPHIKHILWDVHFYYGFNVGDFRDQTELVFPYYLYNDNVFDDHLYLFNLTNLETGINFLRGNFADFSAGVEDNGPFYESLLAADRYNINASTKNRKEILQQQILDANRQLPGRDYYLKQNFSSLDTYMLDVLLPLCNTDTDINLLFSPTTRHFYASTGDINFLYKQIYMRRYLVEHTHVCKNIRVFAFDNLDWIVNDLSNYADSFHFKISINNYIIESVAKNENRLTPENINEYETRLISNINNYKNIFLSELNQ